MNSALAKPLPAPGRSAKTAVRLDGHLGPLLNCHVQPPAGRYRLEVGACAAADEGGWCAWIPTVFIIHDFGGASSPESRNPAILILGEHQAAIARLLGLDSPVPAEYPVPAHWAGRFCGVLCRTPQKRYSAGLRSQIQAPTAGFGPPLCLAGTGQAFGRRRERWGAHRCHTENCCRGTMRLLQSHAKDRRTRATATSRLELRDCWQ